MAHFVGAEPWSVFQKRKDALNESVLLFRFDRLARWFRARLDRAEEEVGHVVAEADHGRLVLAAQRTLAAGRGIGEARSSSGRAARRSAVVGSRAGRSRRGGVGSA